jgi:hypothetical protein
MMKQMWQSSGLLNGPDTTAEWMSAAMERYDDQVKQTVPAERLLVWAPRDGWEPLCEFLELPVPETPFPHLNDTKVFGERIVDGALIAIQEWRARDQSETVAAAPQ